MRLVRSSVGCTTNTSESEFSVHTAREAVLVAKPFKNPLRRVLLLLRPAFVVGQDILNDCDETV